MSSIEDFRASNVNEASVIEVIQVKSYFGDGTEESIGREITEYYSLDGYLLCRVDGYATSNLHLIDKSSRVVGAKRPTHEGNANAKQ